MSLTPLLWFPEWFRGRFRREPILRSPVHTRHRIGKAQFWSEEWTVMTLGLSPAQKGELFDACCLAMDAGDRGFLLQFPFFKSPELVRTGRVRPGVEIQRAVWARDEGRCVQCGATERLEYDHIKPVVFGGETTEENIQLLCRPCNKQKGPQAHARRRVVGG